MGETSQATASSVRGGARRCSKPYKRRMSNGETERQRETTRMASETPGGVSGVQAMTNDVQAIVQLLKNSVVEKLNRPLHVYHAISYRSQVVAGQNYFIKVVIGDADDYIHMRVFQPLPSSDAKLSLEKIQTDKKLCDELEYF